MRTPEERMIWLEAYVLAHDSVPEHISHGPNGATVVSYITTDLARLCADCVNDKSNPVTFGLRNPVIEQQQWNVVDFDDDMPYDPSDDWVCDHCGKVILKSAATLQAEAEAEAVDEEPDDPREPEDGDYVMNPSGPLGSRIGVSIVGERWLGEYADRTEAEAAIQKHMERHSFWPSVWWLSDHGNLEPVLLESDKQDNQLEPRWFSRSYRGGEVLAFVKSDSKEKAKELFENASSQIVCFAIPWQFNSSMWDEDVIEEDPEQEGVRNLIERLNDLLSPSNEG